MKMGRQFLIFLCGLLLAAQCAIAHEDVPYEHKVKAAFLFNFAKFIEWPSDAGALNLCILGEDHFGRAVDDIEGKAAAGKKISVIRIKTVHDIKQCHMLFISASENERLAGILTAARGLNILTVGDTTGYAELGVIVNFFRDQSNIRFEINKDAAERSGLKISSKLFGLARIVSDTPKRRGD